jgi:hypothetical protein
VYSVDGFVGCRCVGKSVSCFINMCDVVCFVVFINNIQQLVFQSKDNMKKEVSFLSFITYFFCLEII